MKIGILGFGKTGSSVFEFFLNSGRKCAIFEKKYLKFSQKIDYISKTLYFEEGFHSSKIYDFDKIIISPGVPPKTLIYKRLKEKSNYIFSEIDLAYLNLKRVGGAELKIIGITGTNGKSTTTKWLEYLLGEDAVSCGNVGFPFIKTPTFKKYYIVEVSSFQLFYSKFFKPDIAVILNLKQDHFDYHGTFEEYKKAKFKIALNQKEDDFLVLNADEKVLYELDGKVKSKILWFSLNKEVSGIYKRGNYLFLNDGKRKFKIVDLREIKFKGIHLVYNFMAVLLVLYLLGVNIWENKDFYTKLRSLPHLPYRIEYVEAIDGVEVYNDSKSTTPHSTLWALRSFEKNVVLLIGGLNKGLSFSEVAKEVAKRGDIVFLFGQSGEEIAKDFAGKGIKIKIFKSMEEAVQEAVKYALDNNIKYVLFSPGCASFDEFENYRHRGEVFNKIVQKIKNEGFN